MFIYTFRLLDLPTATSKHGGYFITILCKYRSQKKNRGNFHRLSKISNKFISMKYLKK